MTEFSLDVRKKETKEPKKKTKAKKESVLKPAMNLPRKFEPVRKKEEKKEAKNIKEQLASRLLIHNTLLRSCMASFYST